MLHLLCPVRCERPNCPSHDSVESAANSVDFPCIDGRDECRIDEGWAASREWPPPSTGRGCLRSRFLADFHRPQTTGLTACRSITRPKPLRCDHGLRRQAIVETLMEDVIRGGLQPGQHLVTQAMAEPLRRQPHPGPRGVDRSGRGRLHRPAAKPRGGRPPGHRGRRPRDLPGPPGPGVRGGPLGLRPDRPGPTCSASRDDLQALLATEAADRPRSVRRARDAGRPVARPDRSVLGQRVPRPGAGPPEVAVPGLPGRKLGSRAGPERLPPCRGRGSRAPGDRPRPCWPADRPEAIRSMSRHIRSGIIPWSRALPDSRADEAPAPTGAEGLKGAPDDRPRLDHE